LPKGNSGLNLFHALATKHARLKSGELQSVVGNAGGLQETDQERRRTVFAHPGSMTNLINAQLMRQSGSGAPVLCTCVNAKGGHFEHKLAQDFFRTLIVEHSYLI